MSASGQRDRLVTIQERTTGKGASGFPTETWTTLGEEFMHMEPLRGREAYMANQVSASGDTKVTLHYREDMDPESVNVPANRRLSFRGRTHDITSAVHVGRRQAIELVTLAKVDA